MDNFIVIFKILKVLESAMDCDEVDRSLLKAENFKITENRFENIIRTHRSKEEVPCHIREILY